MAAVASAISALPTTHAETDAQILDANNDHADHIVVSSRDDGKVAAATDMLVRRMQDVLQRMEYDNVALHKVAERVRTNTVQSPEIYADEFLFDNTEDISRLLDEEVLNGGKLREQGIYLNSNEPVLVLEVPHSSVGSRSEVRALKDRFLTLLIVRGIRPVRVYVRSIEDIRNSHFKFCLLNVVNTDIGGPSMIQLLDAAFHVESWKEHLLIKEAYSGYDLLWRDESWVEESYPEQLNSAEPSHKVEEADAGGNDLAGRASPDGIPSPEDADARNTLGRSPVLVASHRYADVDAVLEDKDESESEAVEHPAMRELRETDAQRGSVLHPTWSRDHEDEGLLDIITTQSAGLNDNEPLSVIVRPVTDANDDFELVDKV